MSEMNVGETNVRLVQGDITEQAVDAVVNAANSSLMGGGGVDGAIHSKGGPVIKEECKQIREKLGSKLPVGEAVLTTGGNLPADHVIHTVGPRWSGGESGEPQKLENAYRNSLEVASAERLDSVAFPSISTGAYGYPIDRAARVALGTVRSVLESGDLEHAPREVRFVLFSDDDLAAYQDALENVRD